VRLGRGGVSRPYQELDVPLFNDLLLLLVAVVAAVGSVAFRGSRSFGAR
jgi:hypothetical protein